MRHPRKLPLRDGFDPIGPFHPYVVFAGIVLLDLIGVVLLLAALIWTSDRAEDLIWPGGEEWVEF